MKTPLASIVMFLLAALLGALGQLLYKTGADRADSGWQSYVWNARLLGGVACYVAVMVLFVAAFRRGGSMAVLYPLYASTFVWGALLARFAFGTAIQPVHVLGMVLLVVGMWLMGWR